MAGKVKWTSRAVVRPIEAGNSAICVHCDEQVKFKAKAKGQQVICNVYVKGVWQRVEHYHYECYELAGDPLRRTLRPRRPEAARPPASPGSAGSPSAGVRHELRLTRAARTDRRCR